LSELLRSVCSLLSEKKRKQHLKSSYIPIYFDTDEVAEKGSSMTFLVNSSTTAGAFVKMILKKMNYKGTGDDFKIYKVRMYGEMIIYQKRMDEGENVFDLKFEFFFYFIFFSRYITNNQQFF